MKTESLKIAIIFLFITKLLLISCKEGKNKILTEEPFIWSKSDPISEGINPLLIDSINQEITAGECGLIDQVLFIRNGKIIFDKRYEHNYDSISQKYDTTNFQYNYDHPDWHPYYKGTNLHTLQSATKSITSLLVGIAIDEGFISNVDIKVMRFFDSYSSGFKDSLKDSISLEDLLTMRGGIKWDEWSTPYSSPDNSCFAMENSKNWIEYIISQPMDTIPGTKFVYNSGITVLLGEIVKIKTGKRIDKWAEEKLFKPLDIKEYYWKVSPNGEIDTEGGLYLSIYDFAKIGQLVLNEGKWLGKRIISEKWVRNSTSYITKVDNIRGYGYQWWVGSYESGSFNISWVAAGGFGDQYLLNFKEHNLLTVTNGWNIHNTPEKSIVEPLVRLSGSINNKPN
jgi:CubicO group peptidase (beta-lactamase class C family)